MKNKLDVGDIVYAKVRCVTYQKCTIVGKRIFFYILELDRDSTGYDRQKIYKKNKFSVYSTKRK